jgi:hypothetical protein
MALTPADINTKKALIDINKTYTKINNEEIVTEPKTPKSKRIVYALYIYQFFYVKI